MSIRKITLREFVDFKFTHARHNSGDGTDGIRNFCFCEDCQMYRAILATDAEFSENPEILSVSRLSDEDYERIKENTYQRMSARLTEARELLDSLSKTLGKEGAAKLLATIMEGSQEPCDDPECTTCKERSKVNVAEKIRANAAYGVPEEPEWRPGMYL